MPREEQKSYVFNDLAKRLARYGGEIGRLCEELPATKKGRHLSDQLFRSGTSAGAHYGEARGAQSRTVFIQKVSLALQEAQESLHWLETAIESGFFERKDLTELIDEGNQLCRILLASQRTARRNAKRGTGGSK